MSREPLELSGRVVVVGCDQATVARRLAAAGATVVVVGDQPEAAGQILAAVEADGAGRAAFFRTSAPVPDDADLAALAELVAELSR
jgi:NAD(P)-dependent dehydrogenase (short-subunit alcohol dehydrogenase family)